MSLQQQMMPPQAIWHSFVILEAGTEYAAHNGSTVASAAMLRQEASIRHSLQMVLPKEHNLRIYSFLLQNVLYICYQGLGMTTAHPDLHVASSSHPGDSKA